MEIKVSWNMFPIKKSGLFKRNILSLINGLESLTVPMYILIKSKNILDFKVIDLI